MKKFLIIIILAISVTLFGCGSKDDKEVGNAELEEDLIDIENEDEEDIQVEDLEESEEDEDTEDMKDEEELEETAKEIEKEIKESLSNTESEKSEPEKEDKEEKEEVESPLEEKANGMYIEGKVGKPLSLNLEDLKAMNDIIFKGNFYSLNNFGTTAHTEFKGVNLWSLLKAKAEILDDASKVKIIASDGYEMEFTVEQVKRQDYIDETDDTAKFPIIIAWEENGEEYDLDDGLPFKLVVGQKEAGDINKPQWVSNIEKIVVE